MIGTYHPFRANQRLSFLILFLFEGQHAKSVLAYEAMMKLLAHPGAACGIGWCWTDAFLVKHAGITRNQGESESS